MTMMITTIHTTERKTQVKCTLEKAWVKCILEKAWVKCIREKAWVKCIREKVWVKCTINMILEMERVDRMTAQGVDTFAIGTYTVGFNADVVTIINRVVRDNIDVRPFNRENWKYYRLISSISSL